jgi:antitoxin (DNA-binding transcriptional repressor) of toxin-antitoxin stability system
MRTMTIGPQRDQTTCLKLMDQVKAREFVVIITKRGKPIARMILLEPADFSGCTAKSKRRAMHYDGNRGRTWEIFRDAFGMICLLLQFLQASGR